MCFLKAVRHYWRTQNTASSSSSSSRKREIYSWEESEGDIKLSPLVLLCLCMRPVTVKHHFCIPGRRNVRKRRTTPLDQRLQADSGQTRFSRRNSCGLSELRPLCADWSDQREKLGRVRNNTASGTSFQNKTWQVYFHSLAL